MASFFSRMGPWGWGFWILTIFFCLAQYRSAQEVEALLASMAALGPEVLADPGTLAWIFLRNTLLALGAALVSLVFCFALARTEDFFEKAVYRQRREGRAFSFVLCRWQAEEKKAFFSWARKKRDRLSTILLVSRQEIRLTDALIPMDGATLGILVEGDDGEAGILARRIEEHLKRKGFCEDLQLLWSVAAYRPGDSLEELMARARRSLEKGVFLVAGVGC
jgi:hypothetical protein